MNRLFRVCLGAGVLALSVQSANADLPFLKETAGDAQLPRPYGIGVDYFSMEQDYDVTGLTIGLPGLAIDDPSVILVENKIDYLDIKLDAWVFPFLNVFAVLGTLEGDTAVDLSGIALPQLPVPLGVVNINYDGTVYGVGLTSVYGRDNWFVSATATYTDTSLDGDFTSSVKTLTFQPRVGGRLARAAVWVGATYLDAEEDHSGTVDLGIPTLPPVSFDVELSSSERWNMNAGAQVNITPQLDATIEFGFSERQHTLASLTWRF